VQITVFRPGLQGIPNLDGYDGSIGAFDAGQIEFTDPSMVTGAVTDEEIYRTINATRPAGVTCWTKLV
jgi:hypothetical protein